MKKSIYFWSPFINEVGTTKSTINSAISLSKFSKRYDVKIINVFGEWSKYNEIFKKNNIEKIDLTFNYYNFLPKTGFLFSRFSYLIIILLSIIPLIKILKRNKPDVLIVHLITSLPLILFNTLNLNTKLILRISGFPKLNYFRKKLWSISEKNIYKITCPTKQLLDQLLNKKIFSEKKLIFLPDPIIDINEFRKKINDKNFAPQTDLNFDYFLSIGRFTKQKNYLYLINEFEKFLKNFTEIKLLIIGEGEEKEKLKKIIKRKNLNNKILLLNKTENVFQYMKNAKAFILSSLWEDPGFVIIEAALSNLFVISSNCSNGPSEFLDYGKSGILFPSNMSGELTKSLKYFIENENILKKNRIYSKKNCLKYTKFRHYKIFEKIFY